MKGFGLLLVLLLSVAGCKESKAPSVVQDGDRDAVELDEQDSDTVEAEAEPEPEADAAEAEKDVAEVEDALLCFKDADCPGTGCYYCDLPKRHCMPQVCSPTCEKAAEFGLNTTPCAQRTDVNDTCAQCMLDSSSGHYGCFAPRCRMDSDCACRNCGQGNEKCDLLSGLCFCTGMDCGPMEDAFCCPSQNRYAHCPHWCEGQVCEEGYHPGLCNPETAKSVSECPLYGQWRYCDGKQYNHETCTFKGLGIVGDPSCDCTKDAVDGDAEAEADFDSEMEANLER